MFDKKPIQFDGFLNFVIISVLILFLLKKKEKKKENQLKMLFASTTRYIIQRNAIEKVYWRRIRDHNNNTRFVKHTKIFQCKEKPNLEEQATVMFNY